jgi:alpha-methylacyl-CoA racemase
MLLADAGADVTVVLGGRAGIPAVALRRGKREIVLDLKSEAGQAVLHELVKTADVVLEGFRPGVAGRMGASYEQLLAINPRIIYCSVTGYGQYGPLAQAPGHDINYLAIAGLLGALETSDAAPKPPFNVVGDFAAGGLLAAFGIAAALVERERSGKGQAIDVSMVDGAISLAAMVNREFGTPVNPRRAEGLMDGAAPFYRCYKCRDGRYIAVGAAEDRFFINLWEALDLGTPVPPHMEPSRWPEMKELFEAKFLTRTRDEWVEVFERVETCVTPVLDPEEARTHPHNAARGAFLPEGSPAPVPRFSRTPGLAGVDQTEDLTQKVLAEAGIDQALIDTAIAVGSGATPDGMVKWPPY